MQVQIQFTASGSSSAFGNFAPGDLLRCSEAQARHYVDEARCAKYTQPSAAQDEPKPAKANPKKAAVKSK
jgi:hypothetical protein